MSRIGIIDRLGAARPVAAIPARGTAQGSREETGPPSRALAVIEGGRRPDPASGPPSDGRPDARFVAQLIVAGDPSLGPSRLERTRAAAALYARAARRLA